MQAEPMRTEGVVPRSILYFIFWMSCSEREGNEAGLDVSGLGKRGGEGGGASRGELDIFD